MRKFEHEVLSLGIASGNYAGEYTPSVIRVIKGLVDGKILQLYSGSSLIGQERIDISHPNATRNCRVEDFVLSDNHDWDWVILDPPYGITQPARKIPDYGEYGNPLGNAKTRRMLRHYFQLHASNVLWLDYSAPIIEGFCREKLWFFIPVGFQYIRVLSWLKREMKPLF